MNTYEQFKKLNIDFACLGMQQLAHYENYYCLSSWRSCTRILLFRSSEPIHIVCEAYRGINMASVSTK